MEDDTITPQRRNTKINLRISEGEKSLIDDAARVAGTTRTEFMLDSARQHAIDVLLDQRLFLLTDGQMKAFQEALDNPPPPNAALRKLMKTPPPWGDASQS